MTAMTAADLGRGFQLDGGGLLVIADGSTVRPNCSFSTVAMAR